MAKQEKLSLEEKLERARVKAEEQPYSVPDNWVWTRLEYLCTYIQRGKSPKYSEIENIPVISQKCIQWDGFDLSKARFIDPETVGNYTTERFIQHQDLLWNSTGTGTIGRINCYPGGAFSKIVADSHVTIVRPIKGWVSEKFLLYWLSAPYVQSGIDALASGTTNQIELNTSTIKNQSVPLTSIKEQHRIVNAIESLFSKLDRAKELVQTALDSVASRKAAILHQAFSGELTRRWREENEGNETASDLIDRIQEYKRKQGIKVKSEVVRITEDSIPKKWIVTNLGTVVKEFKYGTSEKSDVEYTGIPVIRIPNVVSNTLDFANLKYLSHCNMNEEGLIQKGDLLVIRSNGSRDLVGKCALVAELEKKYAFASYLIRIRPVIVNSKYLLYLLNSSHVRNQLFNKAKSSAGINNINSQELSSIKIPLPTLDEQQEIVRILDHLLEKEQTANELCDVIERIEQLKKAILARAFRGELGTNDPAKESALSLLEEVLAMN